MIIVSRVHDELTIAECLRLGAIGYVQKRSSFDEVEHAIAAALKGELYLCAEATLIRYALRHELISVNTDSAAQELSLP